MKKGYKNKRDQFKAESERFRKEALYQGQEKDRLQRELDSIKIEDKKRWSAIVYCENCKEVNSVSIPPGVSLDEGDCTTCRVRGKLKFVAKVNFFRSF